MKDDFKWNGLPAHTGSDCLRGRHIFTSRYVTGGGYGFICAGCGHDTGALGVIAVKQGTIGDAYEVGGIKNDTGKPDLSLVSLELMEALARVREFGSAKYERNNWKKGFKFNRSIAAALRHIMAFNSGEDLDGESGLTHIAHAIASLEHLLYDYIHHKKENDDRK